MGNENGEQLECQLTHICREASETRGLYNCCLQMHIVTCTCGDIELIDPFDSVNSCASILH